MNKIEQTYDIAATLAEVWRALTDPKIIEEWSGADAVFPLQAGADYSLWDGSIGGGFSTFGMFSGSVANLIDVLPQ